MPKFRADFDVTSDLVLADDAPPLTITTPTSTVTLRNAPKDKQGFVPSLTIQVIADCTSIEAAATNHRELLARVLDILAFSTHSRFEIVQCRRVVDWEPFMQTRRFKMGQVFDPRYPPDPQMDSAYGRTVEVIAKANPERYVGEALRLFRAGLLDKQEQDQFQRFWLALEVVAEGRKGTALQAIRCPQCSHGLACPQCAMSPLRRPMARQAVRSLLTTLLGEDRARAAYSDLIKIRDGLMHGRSRESIQGDLSDTFENILNGLAGIAWHAIMSSMPGAVLETQITMGHRDGKFAARLLQISPIGTFESDPNVEYPPEEKVLSMNIEVQPSPRPSAGTH